MNRSTELKGASLIAQTLKDLGVKVIFGIVGIPVVQIAEEAIALGIRFIAFRNEQAASYAATAYGYLIGKPGICLVVGGPGILHAIAGIGNASINSFPLLLLAGSCESYLVGKGAFQEFDAISFLTPHTKLCVRSTFESIPRSITDAFRTSWYGRAGSAFVDLPADVIQGKVVNTATTLIHPPPRTAPDPIKLELVTNLLKSAKAPLIIIGKGAAYARAETPIRQLICNTRIPFLPTPMGKGVVPDSHPLNTASARSVALRETDVALVLGARLNWILHYGETPKWNESVKIIQVDICAEELGKNGADSAFSIVGDINIVASQLIHTLGDWSYNTNTLYMKAIYESKIKNEEKSSLAAKLNTIPITYYKVFDIIKETLHKLSPPQNGGLVYVSEGANTMDISRSVFSVEYPRLRLDAGTHATMGVGLGYAIAAYCAYNFTSPDAKSYSKKEKKKIICLEGDSAFGFSLAEVETMSRYGMDILIFVINNSGIYHGDTNDSNSWLEKQRQTIAKKPSGLRSTSLGFEVGYEKTAEMCGGKGYLARNPSELAKATEEGFNANVPVVVNVIIEAGATQKLVNIRFPPSPNIFSLRSNTY
ncbi:2-hydroxyacyl-CoA lyase 1 [Erysiphe neolycopersici]|uniref:2-hydroxyacyl-CoA lyase n=1 Tax=Erysiphe neolycopersici TaxID=212602 RepID=A0A420HV41_9PEZI|nr:2-hydroxyacyl-CoA lyase 1 [Erysiphe neolycopersici]